MAEQEDITQLLMDVEARRDQAFDRLLEKVYPVLHEIAHARLRGQSGHDTLQTTDLVHEAYLRLVRYQDINWKGRTHFYGAAAQTMRRILVDHARSKSSQKRKGEQIGLTEAGSMASVSNERLLEIDDALKRLEEIRPRWVRVVECRFFAGLNIEETAEFLDISHGTVSNDWRMARAWLKRELDG